MSTFSGNQSNRTNSAKSGLNLTLDPVETFVFAGLQKKILEVFETKAVWVTSSDKNKALEKLFGKQGLDTSNQSLRYPHAFLTLQRLAKAENRGNSKALSLAGLNTVAMVNDQKRSFRVKLRPTDMSVKLEFVTDDYRKVLQFANTWSFAGDNGWLNFNVLYGGSVFAVSSFLDTEVTIPEKEADLGNVQEYRVEVNLIVQGYLSFATAIEQQIVDTVVEEGLLAPKDSSDPNAPTTDFQIENSSVIWSFASTDPR